MIAPTAEMRRYKREWARAKRAQARAAELPELLRRANAGTEIPTADERAARRRLVSRGAPMAERIWAWIRITDAGCWEWRGKRNHGGYGRICVSQAKGDAQVHRISYETFVGPIPDGAEIHHRCGNRPCCNPEHLEPVSTRENQSHTNSPVARNMRATHCVKGHPLQGENLYVTPDGRRQCRECQRARGRDYAARQSQSDQKAGHISHFATCPDHDAHRRRT